MAGCFFVFFFPSSLFISRLLLLLLLLADPVGKRIEYATKTQTEEKLGDT